MTDKLSTGEKRLIRSLDATGQPKMMIHVNARRTWSLEYGAPGWKAQTFLSLASRGYLTIEYGFAGRKDVALTDAGRAALSGA